MVGNVRHKTNACGAEYWLKELQESMDSYTRRRDKTEMLKMMLNTTQSINQSSNGHRRLQQCA